MKKHPKALSIRHFPVWNHESLGDSGCVLQESQDLAIIMPSPLAAITGNSCFFNHVELPQHLISLWLWKNKEKKCIPCLSLSDWYVSLRIKMMYIKLIWMSAPFVLYLRSVIYTTNIM